MTPNHRIDRTAELLLREIVGLVIIIAIGVSLLALFVAALRHCGQPDADENARIASWVFGLAFAAWLIVLAGYRSHKN